METNRFNVGLNKGGRPPKYTTAESLEQKISEYFESFIDEGEPESIEELELIYTKKVKRPTVTGLALFLGFESKQSLRDYRKRPKFSALIKRALLVIEMCYEEMLETKFSTGAIFALKNMGWSDKQEIDHTTKGNELKPNVISLGQGTPPESDPRYTDETNG